jgi:hypothetical protein
VLSPVKARCPLPASQWSRFAGSKGRKAATRLLVFHWATGRITATPQDGRHLGVRGGCRGGCRGGVICSTRGGCAPPRSPPASASSRQEGESLFAHAAVCGQQPSGHGRCVSGAPFGAPPSSPVVTSIATHWSCHAWTAATVGRSCCWSHRHRSSTARERRSVGRGPGWSKKHQAVWIASA